MSPLPADRTCKPSSGKGRRTGEENIPQVLSRNSWKKQTTSQRRRM
jgi:hypothetical protein